jgi:hypothetical protein
MTRLLLLALLALSGCATLAGDAPADSAQGECQRRAVDDPAVQAATLDANSPLQEVRVLGVHNQEVAMRRAVQRCLAARNGAPVGGVEPVQGGWLGPSLF